MAATLTDAQLDELRTFDSATIANAIEPFKVRDQTLGYVGSNVRALFPNKHEPMVGYAVTAKGDSTTYARRRDPALQFGLWEAMDASPQAVRRRHPGFRQQPVQVLPLRRRDGHADPGPGRNRPGDRRRRS